MSRQLQLLSVVIPCHNEEAVLPSTHERLTGILAGLIQKKLIANYEIVLVNNGSKDNTVALMLRLFKNDPHVHVVDLRRNFGYQASITAGLNAATGDAVVTIDADLQDPPEKIEEMIGHYTQGFDLVLGVRNDRSTDSFFKRVFSQFYYRFSQSMGVDIVYNHADFRLMDRSLLDQFKDMHERDRFIRAMILYLDNHYACVYYERQTRKLGMTKFFAGDLMALAMDGIISYSYKPLRFMSIFGIFMSLIALALGCWVVFLKLKQNIVVGWASTLLPIVFFGGIQSLFLGLIGEYVGRLYNEIKARPLYAIRKTYKH